MIDSFRWLGTVPETPPKVTRRRFTGHTAAACPERTDGGMPRRRRACHVIDVSDSTL